MTATAAGRSLARSRTRSWHPEPQHAHIDRSFAALGVVVGLLPWGSTFGSWRYLAVGALGAVLGIGCAVVVRWSGRVWLGSAGAVLVVFGALIFVVAGGPAPTRADLTSATLLPVTGWKQLLSTAPPVDAALGDVRIISEAMPPTSAVFPRPLPMALRCISSIAPPAMVLAGSA